MNKPHLRYKNQTRRERTWTIHFISIMKVVKGLILVVVGVKLLSLLNRDVNEWATDFVTRHGIDMANKYVHSALEKLSGVGNTQLMQMSGVAFAYSCLLFTEGIGLWLQKRWAEYLTTIATGLLIPFELYEIYEKFTWVRIGILVLNLFIVWYLVTRLKDEKREILATEFTEKTETRIKICGITDIEDALLAVKLGADELGFNFYKKSPRYIAPKKVGLITQQLPNSVLRIGVFVNESIDKICETAIIANLDSVQLHGDENHEFIENLRSRTDLAVIKALRVTPEFTSSDVVKYDADAILLDGYSPNERGGTGEQIDWEVARQVSDLVPSLYLAGGLTPENVAEAIKKVRPYAVDVCSRIESEPGKKDPEKLRRFIAAVRGTK